MTADHSDRVSQTYEQYPEHEKLAALRIDPTDPWSGRNQLIGDFIGWLRGERLELAIWRRQCGRCDTLNAEDAEECADCGAPARSLGRARLWPSMERTEGLIGRFFGIDPEKLSAEKDAMLAAIRRG